MRQSKLTRTLVLGTIAVLLGGIALYAHANPGMAACALANGLNALPPEQGHDERSDLVAAGRQRISDLFGAPQARPIIVFWRQADFLAKLRLNEYASTHMLGTRACTFVGPKGRNVDVVAHELVHAEVFDRVGPWVRMTQVPVWFDEGLAMQVDHRGEYSLPEDVSTTYIRSVSGPAAFFVANDHALTHNYAAAKLEMARWVSAVGRQEVYARLARMRSGEPFSKVISVQ